MKRAAIPALVVYMLCIPAANWMINHVGRATFPGGPHVIPVGFGYEAPSGVLMIGLALVTRDMVQQTLGRLPVLGAIVAGAALSLAIAPSLALASATAFLLGELADFVVYTPLAERHLYAAVLASGVMGALVDTLVFLWLAFQSIQFWQGTTLGKVWLSLLALPVLYGARHALSGHRVYSTGT